MDRLEKLPRKPSHSLPAFIGNKFHSSPLSRFILTLFPRPCKHSRFSYRFQKGQYLHFQRILSTEDSVQSLTQASFQLNMHYLSTSFLCRVKANQRLFASLSKYRSSPCQRHYWEPNPPSAHDNPSNHIERGVPLQHLPRPQADRSQARPSGQQSIAGYKPSSAPHTPLSTPYFTSIKHPLPRHSIPHLETKRWFQTSNPSSTRDPCSEASWPYSS